MTYANIAGAYGQSDPLRRLYPSCPFGIIAHAPVKELLPKMGLTQTLQEVM